MAVSVGGNALGDSATVVGRNGFAGDYGTAMGKGAEASGYAAIAVGAGAVAQGGYSIALGGGFATGDHAIARSEEHTSELQSLMRISYAVTYLQHKKKSTQHIT